jgi:metal-dependent hydrolase (beta-lactamase superfamily II)
LQWLEVKNLDGIIVTHEDKDHSGGVIRFLEENKAAGTPILLGSLIHGLPLNYLMDKTQVRIELEKYFKQSNLIFIDVNKKLLIEHDLKKFKLTITRYAEPHGSDPNPASLCTLVEFGDFSYLGTGDLTVEHEHKIRKSAKNKHICVLKCGHHGAETSTDEHFLAQIKPSTAVISAGYHNHMHPRKLTLAKLTQQDSVKRIVATNCAPANGLDFLQSGIVAPIFDTILPQTPSFLSSKITQPIPLSNTHDLLNIDQRKTEDSKQEMFYDLGSLSLPTDKPTRKPLYVASRNTNDQCPDNKRLAISDIKSSNSNLSLPRCLDRKLSDSECRPNSPWKRTGAGRVFMENLQGLPIARRVIREQEVPPSSDVDGQGAAGIKPCRCRPILGQGRTKIFTVGIRHSLHS